MKWGIAALLIVGLGCSTPVAVRQSGHVGRSTFTTAIKNREPRDNVTVLPNDHQKVFYFTELRNMTGQTVRHRWKYKGKVMAEVRFKVRGPRWRVYSSKWLEKHMVGNWQGSVIDSRGRTLSSATFRYAEAAKARRKSKGYVPAAPAEEGLYERGLRGARSVYDQVFGDD